MNQILPLVAPRRNLIHQPDELAGVFVDHRDAGHLAINLAHLPDKPAGVGLPVLDSHPTEARRPSIDLGPPPEDGCPLVIPSKTQDSYHSSKAIPMRGAMTNGHEFLAARTNLGLTQEQLAALADVDVKTVRKAEQGKRLDLGTLTRLAYALKTDLRGMIVSSRSQTARKIRRRDIVMHWHRAWDAHDHDAVLAVYGDDAVLRLPGGPVIPFGGTFRGKSEIRRANEIAWSTYRTEPDRLEDLSLLVSDEAVILKAVKGINLPTGELARLGWVHLFTFRGDLIIEHQVEFDTLAFARLLPLPPPGEPPITSR